MKNKKDNFHEELRAQLLQNPEFVEEYEKISSMLKLAEELKSARAKSKMTLEDVAKKNENICDCIVATRISSR
ncbi:MAG: hypothetical protein K0R14_440 [Burkholderiales bacterium]|jgi:hypothetical protein|nr:hypothetical protein [Burkholderiales bacterium]